MNLRQAVTSAQKKLDDEEGLVWNFEELSMYAQDGYDIYCRQTKCLFDILVVENIPQTGNWSTDLERFLVEQRPGMGLTDERLNFTSETERNLSVGGLVGGSTSGPTPGTAPYEGKNFDHFEQPTKVATATLPDSIVDIQRVTWDELELFPEDSATMRRMDIQYEQREGGDPRSYTLDKDGIHTIRFVPPARGDAEYPTVIGSWGTMTQTDDASVGVVGSWGILRESTGYFPSMGPHGSPTRRHPAAKNIGVEVARRGRLLTGYPFEIPEANIKHVIFWMLHRALERNGPGQDLKMAKHYGERFGVGIARTVIKLKRINKEFVMQMASTGRQDDPFGMGDPQLPYPYGPSTGRIR